MCILVDLKHLIYDFCIVKVSALIQCVGILKSGFFKFPANVGLQDKHEY